MDITAGHCMYTLSCPFNRTICFSFFFIFISLKNNTTAHCIIPLLPVKGKNFKCRQFFLHERRGTKIFRKSSSPFSARSAFLETAALPCFYDSYPLGFCDCHLHVSSHISSSPLSAFQPSTLLALSTFPQTFSISPSRRGA